MYCISFRAKQPQDQYETAYVGSLLPINDLVKENLSSASKEEPTFAALYESFDSSGLSIFTHKKFSAAFASL